MYVPQFYADKTRKAAAKTSEIPSEARSIGIREREKGVNGGTTTSADEKRTESSKEGEIHGSRARFFFLIAH